MKNKILIIITLFLTACSNNQEEQRIHQEKIEVGKSITTDYLNDHLKALNEELNDAVQKQDQLRKFQIGRSQSSKRKQLLAQGEIIKRIESEIQRTEKEISLTKLFQSYEFQETPEGTVGQIFQAALYKDFTKMRCLMDPYGEYSQSIFKLCMVSMKDEESQQKWSELFASGRIMKKLRQTDNEADIEIAIGPTSSQLVTLRLIKRLDRWFLKEG